ncbi:transposase [Methylosinus sp. H3A]|uniref:transposase n=1 Tax=Methylosinus sp. H3A TaxID=2785786 RepID=UPI0018C236F7|nr:transposase [Methylosinus sp. H3A]MBG0808176.1 transposase [Methylosinus sp. H3A]
MKRLGLPTSDDTILRHLKHNVVRGAGGKVRVLGVDEWSWLKGVNYGTIMVDLERREVVDVLPDRSAASTAVWLGQHAEVEISRDRCGLHAQGAREGAPQARQVADRFHLLQNLRETIEKQMSRADRGMACPALSPAAEEHDGARSRLTKRRQEMAEHRRLTRQAHHRSRQAIFDRVQILKNARATVRDIARDLGVGWRCKKMDTRDDRACPNRTNAHIDIGEIFSRIPSETLVGRLHPGPSIVRGNQIARIFGQLFEYAAGSRTMGARETFRTDVIFCTRARARESGSDDANACPCRHASGASRY